MAWICFSTTEEDYTMHQEIPEHPASHFANIAVIIMILLAILYMVKEWAG